MITRDYDIASGNLVFDSPTLAGLTSSVNNQVAALQVIAGATALLPAVQGLASGTLTDPTHPGVGIDLATGTVTIDLAKITTLNGRPANTELITPALLSTITASISAVITNYGNRITTALAPLVTGSPAFSSAWVR